MIVASQNTQNSHINDINQLNNNMFILFKVFNKEKLTKFEEERYNELQISKLNVSQLKELINSKFMNDYFNDEDNEATREFEERLLALENKYSTEAYSSNINSYVTEKDWLDLRKEVKSQIQRFLDFHKFVKKSWEWLLENGENIGGGLELTGTGLDVGIAALGLIGAGFHILKHTIGNKEYSKEHIIIALDFVLETSKKVNDIIWFRDIVDEIYQTLKKSKPSFLTWATRRIAIKRIRNVLSAIKNVIANAELDQKRDYDSLYWDSCY